jgi:hypothetical protein
MIKGQNILCQSPFNVNVKLRKQGGKIIPLKKILTSFGFLQQNNKNRYSHIGLFLLTEASRLAGVNHNDETCHSDVVSTDKVLLKALIVHLYVP